MVKRSIIPALALIFLAGAVFGEDGLRRTIIETAKQYQGVAYRYGAESPKAFDCSGFVRYVYRTAAGIELPRSSRNIWASGQTVPIAEARPGDIVVFAARQGGAVDHVAILVDDASVIHAVSQGPKTGVIISPLTDRYFGPRILGVRTFIISSESEPLESSEPLEPAPSIAQDARAAETLTRAEAGLAGLRESFVRELPGGSASAEIPAEASASSANPESPAEA
ncbi:MAG: C40 family peptidase [Spirochaetaceae bacterium]|jgi:hypothetical protein|nr:C40 family peptidase [Spirochaetaceae bacterium]